MQVTAVSLARTVVLAAAMSGVMLTASPVVAANDAGGGARVLLRIPVAGPPPGRAPGERTSAGRTTAGWPEPTARESR